MGKTEKTEPPAPDITNWIIEEEPLGFGTPALYGDPGWNDQYYARIEREKIAAFQKAHKVWPFMIFKYAEKIDDSDVKAPKSTLVAGSDEKTRERFNKFYFPGADKILLDIEIVFAETNRDHFNFDSQMPSVIKSRPPLHSLLDPRLWTKYKIYPAAAPAISNVQPYNNLFGRDFENIFGDIWRRANSTEGGTTLSFGYYMEKLEDLRLTYRDTVLSPLDALDPDIMVTAHYGADEINFDRARKELKTKITQSIFQRCRVPEEKVTALMDSKHIVHIFNVILDYADPLELAAIAGRRLDSETRNLFNASGKQQVSMADVCRINRASLLKIYPLSLEKSRTMFKDRVRLFKDKLTEYLKDTRVKIPKKYSMWLKKENMPPPIAHDLRIRYAAVELMKIRQELKLMKDSGIKYFLTDMCDSVIGHLIERKILSKCPRLKRGVECGHLFKHKKNKKFCSSNCEIGERQRQYYNDTEDKSKKSRQI